MNLDNGRISERQAFRIGVLENIAIGIVLIPYVTINAAGSRHFYGFLVGLAMTFIYGAVLFWYSKLAPEGMIEAINDNLGGFGRVIDAVYVLRYVLRASVILLYFGTVVHEYMLRNLNLWVLIVPFIIICGYGAYRDIEKRGRLLELLFWWMIVPLILVAVFSISNIDAEELPAQMFYAGESETVGDVFFGGYLVMIVLSSCELLMFTVTKQKKNHWKNALKTILWIFIAVLLAYVFIIGILGSSWASASSTAALNVMEASAFPGGLVERMDYPVLSFWILGIFAVISGYMFYAKEFSGELFRIEKPSGFLWIMVGIIILILITVGCLGIHDFSKWIAGYIIWFDPAISLLVPLIVVLVRRGRKAR